MGAQLKLVAPDSHAGLELSRRAREALVRQKHCDTWDVVLDKLADTVESRFNGSEPVPSHPNHQGQYHSRATACQGTQQFRLLYELMTLQKAASSEALSVIHPTVDAAGRISYLD